MKKRMLGIAIIGTGAISDSHIEGYLQMKDYCCVLALVNRTAKRAQERKERFHLEKAKVFASLDELFDSGIHIDLASVCLPPSMHCETSIRLLERGIHVLCEKPMAPSLADCDRMIKAAERGGANLSIVAQNRFKADVMRAHGLLESGVLGRRFFAQCNSFWWRGENYYKLHWRGTWESEGGGCTLNHGIHHMDLLLWMMGPVSSVTALVENEAHANSETEDVSIGILRFENGGVGSVANSLLHHGEKQSLMIDCEKGSIELPWRLEASRQRPNGYPETNEELLKQLQKAGQKINPQLQGFPGQIEDVVMSVLEKRKPLVTGEDGRRVIELISGIYQSAFLNQTVYFPMDSQEPFYTAEGIQKHACHFHEKTDSVDAFEDDTLVNVGGTL